MENVKNSVRLTGFAGADPVIIVFANQKRMARVSIAVKEFYKNSEGEPINQTQWFNLIFWNKKVELIESIVKKGTLFSLEGKLNTQSYVDKIGVQRFTTEVLVNAIELVNKEEGQFKENKEEGQPEEGGQLKEEGQLKDDSQLFVTVK